MHFALLLYLLQSHVNDNGACGCRLGGIQRCQCQGPTKSSWRGLWNESHMMVRCSVCFWCCQGLHLPPCTTTCLCQTDSDSSVPCAAVTLDFFFLRYYFKHHNPRGSKLHIFL